jgi:DNA-binding NtrC family response regulator
MDALVAQGSKRQTRTDGQKAAIRSQKVISSMETRPTVLIVDDVDSMRSILRIIVEHAGMEAIEAGDGQTALHLIEHKAADVVLLDVRMPGMDGYEVLRRAKELDSSLPVIMITAFGGIQDAIHMVKHGAIDYLPKPFSNEEIIQKILEANTLRRSWRPTFLSASEWATERRFKPLPRSWSGWRRRFSRF